MRRSPWTLPQRLAKVFLNGKEAGSIEWPGGTLDITKLAAPGSKAELLIGVDAFTKLPANASAVTTGIRGEPHRAASQEST